MDFVAYQTEFELLSPKEDGIEIQVRAGCLDITFVNMAGTDAFVNNMPLLAGSSFSVSGQTNQFDTSSYRVRCAKPVGSIGVWVVRKLYSGLKNMDKL